MDRRTVLKSVGCSTVILLAGCSSDDEGGQEESTPTQNHHTAIDSSNRDFPSYSGTVTISGDDDFWSFALDMANKFNLSYTVTNTKSDDFDFDVFVFSQQEYNNYVGTVQGNDSSPDAIDSASSEGIRESASKNVELEAGTYYFVVDNTDIGDAGDIGSEETREVQVELQTREPGETTPTNTATETETETTAQETRHGPDETFTVGSGDKSLQYTVRPDGLYENVGISEANGIFFVVELDIKNVGNESVTLSSDMYNLVNEDGQEFDPSTSAMAQMENSLLFEQLNPGVDVTGHIPFDIPRQGEHAYALVIEPAGALSLAESHIVELANVDL